MIAGQGSDTLSFLPGESYILRNLSALDVDTLSLDPALKAGFIAMRREALKHLKALAEGLSGQGSASKLSGLTLQDFVEVFWVPACALFP